MAQKKSKLAVVKTTQNTASVTDFLNTVIDDQKRTDSFVLLELMKKVSKVDPKMWGASLIGFGEKRYKSPASGREVDWFIIGFSPRKANLSLYLMINHKDYATEIAQLGKHKTAGGCININKLSDIDLAVLKRIIDIAVKQGLSK